MCKEMLVIPVNKVVDQKKNNWKIMEGRGGGEAQGVADPKMVSFLIFCRFGEFSPIG
jgi:hypothetical protein